MKIITRTIIFSAMFLLLCQTSGSGEPGGIQPAKTAKSHKKAENTTPDINPTQRLASLCKIWGFLKYYHPRVAKGKYDWDRELIDEIPAVLQCNTKVELNALYLKWIAGLGKVKICSRCNNKVSEGDKYNLDLKWMNDSLLIGDSLKNMLHFIEHNRARGKNFYVQQNLYVGNTIYTNEKPYDDSTFAYPPAAYRLLGLFRYWNIINYYYPYKYIIGDDWNTVLDEMIPLFKDAKDTMAYHLAMLELTASINDCHAQFSSDYTQRFFGTKMAPFNFRIIDNAAVVVRILNDSLAAIDDIRIGDAIKAVDGKSIAGIIAEKSRYVGASNKDALLRKMQGVVLNGETGQCEISFDRDGVVRTKTIHRYKWLEIKMKPRGKEVYRIIDKQIGYVNMGLLQPEEVESVMTYLGETKAIIFDVRNYPNGTMYLLSAYLNPEPHYFAKFSNPDMSYPGTFFITEPYVCGTYNSDRYQGKVILLFDARTQSHAEFTVMALQTAPEVKTFGSSTAGADGNVSEIVFPGGYKTFMTGIGVYYPNGHPTQRIGIAPDIEVRPTLKGIRVGKDEVLERALIYAETGK